MKHPKFQIFTGRNQQYYFHLKSGNGEIICSSEGYTSLQNCKKGIMLIKMLAPAADTEILDFGNVNHITSS